MARADIYPFAGIGEYSGERYPDWIRGLGRKNGVYFIRERSSGTVVYIGESHSDRLYATLTRHFQQWTDKYNTAGATYDRDDIEVAVVIVPKTHALYLQNELICIFEPPDNRLICGEIFEGLDDDDEARAPPRGYDYDVERLIDGLFYQFEDSRSDSAVPF